MKELAIVGIFYDGYYDIWEDFLDLYSRFCSDVDYPLYIVNNSKDLNYKKAYNVKVLHAGVEAEYSKKIQTALSEIDAKRYLILLEDFFFTNVFPQEEIEKILEFMNSNNVDYYSMPLPEFLKTYKGSAYKNSIYLQNIDSNSEYTVCCQPAIWSKEFLQTCIGTENYNAWIFEGIYSKSKMSHTPEFLNKCVVDTRNVLGLRHGALQSRMIPDTVNALTDLGYKMNNKRAILSKSAYKKHLRKQWLKSIVPVPLQKVIKKVFKTDSVIERYSDEIEEVMKKLGVN